MKSWDIVSLVLKTLKKEARAGVKLADLSELAEGIVTTHGGVCVDKNYLPENIEKIPLNVRPKSPFPNPLVININSVIAHGIFTEGYKLKKGDVVAFDIGVKKDGICADGAFTMAIPPVSTKDERLIHYAHGALMEGVKQVKAGVNVKDISRAIELYVVRRGYVVNQAFTGHGIGEKMHMDPLIPHFTFRGQPDYILSEGQMICLEPMLTYMDRFGMRVNDWSVVTRDGKNSAFFETQLLVTKDGCQQLIDLPELDEEKGN